MYMYLTLYVEFSYYCEFGKLFINWEICKFVGLLKKFRLQLRAMSKL